MNLDNVFNEVLINELARADLKGAEKALKDGDWDEVAKIYIQNTENRGMDDHAKVIAGLGSTFRPKKGEEDVLVGKDEDGETITLTKDDVVALKKAIKKHINYETKATKKSNEKAKKAAEQSEKDSEDLKNAMPKTELIKNKNESANEIYNIIDYINGKPRWYKRD